MYKEYEVKYGTGAMITANENCFLVGGIHVWWERNKNLVAGSLLGKIFSGGGMRKLLAAGGTPPIPLVGTFMSLNTLTSKSVS